MPLMCVTAQTRLHAYQIIILGVQARHPLPGQTSLMGT